MKRMLAIVILLALLVGVAGAADTIMREVGELLPGASVSLSPFDTSDYDKLGVYTRFGNADTATWRLFYSQDGTNYMLIDSTTVSCAANVNYARSYWYPETFAWRQLAHTATVGANNTVHFDSWMYRGILITVTNKATLDTANFKISLHGIRY